MSLGLSEARAALRRCFPALGVARMEELQQGWDSLTILVNDDHVFRIPRRPEVVRWLRNEIRVLPELVPHLPAAIPEFEFACLEHGVVGYRRIEGRAMDPSALKGTTGSMIAGQMGAFLAILHGIPLDESSAAAVRDRWLAQQDALFREFHARVFPLLDPDERAIARAMFERFLADRRAFEPSWVHCDLGPDHILWRPEAGLAGVIDWSHVSLGDPAIDLAWLSNGTNPRFADALIPAYGGIDQACRERTLFFHRIGPWHEVLFGLRHDRPDLIDSGLSGVRTRLPPDADPSLP